MATTKLSSKGQVILPKSVREAHRWRAGTEFQVEDRDDGVLLRPTKLVAASTLEAVAGRLAGRGRAKTVEQMDATVGAELKARRDRGRY